MTFLNRHRSRIRPVGPFSPSSLFFGGIPGAWYDPTDLSTMFQDSAGTTPVTAVEQPVGLILDKKMPYTSVGYRSIVFDGTGDYLTLGGQSAFAWGAGDFTVEFWFYTAAGGAQALVDTRPAGTSPTSQYFSIAYVGGAVNYYTAGLNPAIAGAAVPLNTWTHVAVSRSGTSTRMFINGTQTGVTYVDAQNYLVGASRPVIGADGNNTAAINFQGGMSNFRMVKGTALYTANFTPSTTPLTAVAGTSLLTGQNATIVDNSSNAFAITVNGNTTTGWDSPFGANARQSTAASRPTYRARYNLLTQSQDFTQAVWTKNNVTVTANAATAPDGTSTATAANEGTATNYHNLTQLTGTVTAPGSYTVSAFAKNISARYVILTLTNAAGNYCSAVYDTVTATVANSAGSGTGFSVTSTSIVSVGNGWYRCAMTCVVGASADFNIGLTDSTTIGPFGLRSYTGTSRQMYIWGAQLLTAADVTATGNAYQRIAAATVYDTAPIFRPYLAFDGLDDSLATAAINFTATDKMTVFAGVTKLQESTSLIAELSTGTVGPGVFGIGTTVGGPNYFSSLTGTANAYYTESTFAAPVTNVLATGFDIAGAAIANEIFPRVNAAIPTLAATGANAGTGNFGTWPLYVGRRASTSLPFNGRLYSLIVRGAASSTTEIADTELWVNARTGAF